MRDARQISAREVSQGVQRHVLDQTTWFGCTVVARSGAVPLDFELASPPGSVRRIMDEARAGSGPR
jgi:hypothetical protein